jgi:precorrin isomerase
MTEKGLVDLVEEWQTGFFLVVGSVAVGFLAAFALGQLDVPYAVVLGLLGGTAAAFLAVSYLLYGR